MNLMKERQMSCVKTYCTNNSNSNKVIIVNTMSTTIYNAKSKISKSIITRTSTVKHLQSIKKKNWS